ncbi:MAG TPA: helicase associated domain-containing protein [Arthrobacter sp.]
MNLADERRTIAAIAAFRRERGTWPSPAAASVHERTLGVWLNTQRIDAGRKTIDLFRLEVLDEELPGWQVTAEDAWLASAREASSFLLLHGRQPSMAGPECGERLIATWLKTNQSAERLGMLRPDRGTWLDSHCPGWRSLEKPVFPDRKGPSLV